MRQRFDPRYYQIAVLTLLLFYGLLRLQFDQDILRVVVTLMAVLVFQFLCSRLWRLSSYEWKSALISGLSLCLLLRTNFLWLILLAAAVTIGSKFLIRWRGKHLFNPTNFGIVLLLLLTDQVWVSSGQWGSQAFFAFLMACLGGLVVNRAARSDVTIAFLLFYVGLLFGRSLGLGEPMSIPIHRLQSGALILFSFFMISDPKTTPDSRAGRILFAFLVALGAGFVQFKLFRTNGLLWSLAACHLLVPAIDRLLPDRKYEWNFKPGGSYASVPS